MKEGKWQLTERKIIFGKEIKLEERKGQKKVITMAKNLETGEEINTWGLQVLRKNYIDPKGKEQSYIVSGGSGLNWSMIAPFTKDSKVILVKQYKQGIDEEVIEFPAGMKLSGQEDFHQLALRELQEETGYGNAEEFLQLSDPLFISTRKAETYFIPFLATGLEKVSELHLDPTEDINVIVLSIPEWLSMIEKGEIKDANSIATTLLALLKLKGKKIKKLFS